MTQQFVGTVLRSPSNYVMKVTSRCVVALGALFVLSGCATPSPGGQVSLIGVDQVRAAPPEIPQPVRWGGTIASVDNLEDGTTSVEIVSRPLARDGRPVRNDSTDGRFIAEINEVLDPSIIKAGRDITVLGLVDGELRDGNIGDSPYRYPVVAVDDYHFWQPGTARRYAHSNYCYGCGYGYGYGYGRGHGFGYGAFALTTGALYLRFGHRARFRGGFRGGYRGGFRGHRGSRFGSGRGFRGRGSRR